MKKCAETGCSKRAEHNSNYCEDHQKNGPKETRIYKEKNTENNSP
jgi:hypothetical protein